MRAARISTAVLLYIINPNIRKSIGLNVKDAIIVFDEGHNLEN